MKILIVANAFPPLNSIASQRPYSWARYWSRAGHDICVLTSEKTAASGWLDLKIDPGVEKRIRIEAVPFLVFRRKNRDASRAEESRSQGTKLTLARRLVRFLRRNIFGSFLDSRAFWIEPAVRRGLEIYENWKFELIVSSYDPPAAHIIASRLHGKLGVPWAADYRDLWVGSHIEKPVFPLDLLEKAVEDRTMKGAFLLSTVSDDLRRQLASRFPQPVVTVENGYEEEDFKTAGPPYRFEGNGCLRIIYTGKLIEGKQDPSPLFQALAIMRDQGKLQQGRLEVLFFGQWLEHLPGLIERYRVDDYVRVMGFLDRQTILRMQKSADLLLFLEFNAPGVDGILTGKLFEYMISGRPVLGIGAEERKATARLIRETGIGVTFPFDPREIAQFLERFMNGETGFYKPNQEVIERYSRRNLAEKLLHEIMLHLE